MLTPGGVWLSKTQMGEEEREHILEPIQDSKTILIPPLPQISELNQKIKENIMFILVYRPFSKAMSGNVLPLQLGRKNLPPQNLKTS